MADSSSTYSVQSSEEVGRVYSYGPSFGADPRRLTTPLGGGGSSLLANQYATMASQQAPVFVSQAPTINIGGVTIPPAPQIPQIDFGQIFSGLVPPDWSSLTAPAIDMQPLLDSFAEASAQISAAIAAVPQGQPTADSPLVAAVPGGPPSAGLTAIWPPLVSLGGSGGWQDRTGNAPDPAAFPVPATPHSIVSAAHRDTVHPAGLIPPGSLLYYKNSQWRTVAAPASAPAILYWNGTDVGWLAAGSTAQTFLGLDGSSAIGFHRVGVY